MSTSYLLDTNALSEASKKLPNQDFMSWFVASDEEALFTSCLVLGEIKKGIALSPDPKKQERLNKLLDAIVESFDDRIIGIDTAIALLWGKLTASGRLAGKTPPAIDALIAAQCIAHDLTLVTRNVKDFEQFTELKVLSPWAT